MKQTRKAMLMSYANWIACKDKFETLGAWTDNAFLKNQCIAWAYESAQRAIQPEWQVNVEV